MKLKSDSLKDFKDLLGIFNQTRVRYLIVGAHAMSQWGYTRATGDLDILVIPTKQNAARLILALKEFGAPTAKLSVADFAKKEAVLQIGVPPLRIDILTSIDGVTAKNAFETAKKGTLLGLPVRFLSLDNLIRNKSATGRAKDKLDVEELKTVLKKKAE